MVIKKYIFILLASLSLGFSACSEDMDLNHNGKEDAGELAVDFDFNLPELNTRALNGSKTSFGNGDVIHISGVFTLTNDTQEIRYGALSYSSSQKKWVSVTDSKLTWPNTAVKGKFTAYHIPTLNESQGSIITNYEKNISLLQEVTVTSDPLYSESEEVSYGNGVKMNFSHLCTYLTLENLTPAYDSFIFSAESIRDNQNSQSTIEFNNAFYLQLKYDNTLDFGFCQSDDDIKTITSTTVKNTNSNSGNVSFFLQPGYYDKFTILYPTGVTPTPFLNYQYIPLSDETNTPPQLNAGTAYTLNTVTSSGIIIESPSQEENKPWPEDKPMQVDVDKFLTAISKNEAYSENDYKILTKTNTGLKLNYNIDFNNYEYIWLKNGDYPNVPTGEILDGDNHTLSNLCCPLFNINYGTITNLRISTLMAQKVILNQYATNVEDPNTYTHTGQYDFSRQGGVCRINNGKIINVRMTDISIIAEVITDNDGDNESNQDTENIGLITGSNTGKIDNIRLSGTLSLTVNTSSTDTNGSNCTINIGGLIGQITDSGSINDIGALDEGEGLKVFKVVNNCSGDAGAYYVGGLVGFHAGYIGPIGIPFIDIDCSASKCTKSFIGLLAGEITTSTAKSSTIVGANVSGNVKGGTIFVYNDLDSGSYIGGICGASVLPNDGIDISVTDCMIVAQTLDNSKAINKKVINCTGGCFGRIYKPFTVNNITLNIGAINYPGRQPGEDYYAGTFAGLAPTNQVWNWNSNGNRLAYNNSGIEDTVGSNSLGN